MTNLLCGFLVLATIAVAVCATVGWECTPHPNPTVQSCGLICLETRCPERVFVRPLPPLVGLVAITALLEGRRRFVAKRI